MEFPNGCLTSTYALNGFEDFAYVVCTVATPPGTQHAIVKESNVSRLKNAERELRAASLLVSTDVDKLELFMFYRKLDLLRDQKILIAKIAPVLRTNYLIRSYNSGGKAVHLLKPEQSRIYALFTRAILSSVWPLWLASSNVIPLGSRSYVRNEEATSVHFQNETFPDQRTQWILCDVDIQILENGTVLMTSTAHGDVPLTSVADLLETKMPSDSTGSGRFLVRLAPTGQVARYITNRTVNMGHADISNMTEDVHSSSKEEPFMTAARQEVWRKKLSGWLRSQQAAHRSDDNQIWAMVEVPTIADTASESGKGSVRTVWKKLEWPAELCFCYRNGQADTVENNVELDWSPEDPWEFMENWNANARDRKDEILRKEKAKLKDQNVDGNQSDFEMSEDELQFGYTPHFQSHGPADFLPSQLMYPTPPDGALTQATPGMSSLDGIDMTPAQMARPVPEPRRPIMDDDITDVDELQTGGVGSGLYDEDLFEDIPGENFGPAGGADEPNWDFFDQPDFDMPDVETSGDNTQNQRAEVVNEGRVDSLNTNTDTLSPRTGLDGSGKDSASLPRSSDAPTDNVSIGLGDVPRQSLTEITQAEKGMLPQTGEHNLAHKEMMDSTNEHQGLENDDSDGNFTRSKRRRSSIYELDATHPRIHPRDASYSSEGKYWFKSTVENLEKSRPFGRFPRHEMYIGGFDRMNQARPASISGSDTSSSSEDDERAKMEGLNEGGYRGWTEYNPVVPEPTSPTTNKLELDSLEREATELIELLQFDNYELPLLQDNFQETTNMRLLIDVEADDLTTIAQILVDILSQTSFQQMHRDVFAMQAPNREVSALIADLGKLDPAWEHADLESFTLAGVSPESADANSKIDRLEDSRIRVSRADQPLLAFSAIKPLWDSLGLQPNGGEKDITAYCIHPGGKNVADGCGMLLERMHETYLSCNFGAHLIGQLGGTANKGLIGWSSQDDALPNLEKACEQLGTELARHPPATGVVIIYMVNSSTSLTSYVQLCQAFYVLFSTYRKACGGGKTKMVDIALQVVPIGFVASPDTIVVPTQNEYLNLAIEVYNRCPPNSTGDSLAICGSAIVLAETMRRNIEFDLTTQHSSPLSKDGKCLHVAYCHSTDKRWVTAAWTDELGHLALTMSYCLRSKGSRSSRRLTEVIQEIWEVSHDLMAKHRSKWRLVIAKNGSYEAEEINDWLFHANSAAKDKTSTCTLVLISINLNPSLTLSLPPSQQRVPAQGPSPSQPTRDYGTPVTTPQAANITSPDQLMAPTPIPTPGGPPASSSSPPREDHIFDPTTDTDLTVNDPTEESWCVLLSHGLNQSRNILDVRPAMASGYLLKRRGAKDEDGVVSLGVNLIHTPIPAHEQALREDLLREIIVHYRGLVTLAVTRGCLVDAVKECVPWHISTAVKGARVLGMVL